jgi:IS1 family transposase
MLLEKISMAGIARVVGVSERWLQIYVNKKCESVKLDLAVDDLEPVKKNACEVIAECGELWSFVWKHDEKQWVWLALDREARGIVGACIGDRSAESAKESWLSIPENYRNRAVAYTDFWEAHSSAIPKDIHRAVGKDSGQTDHVERFDCTLRQRVSRLVRKSLSFSKKLENHIGAIFYFIRRYNATIKLRYCVA